MKIKRTELLDILQKVQPGLGNEKSIVEQSACFVFQGQEVMTFNDEVAICHPISTEDKFELTGAVQAKELFNLLRRSKDDVLNITLTNTEFIVQGIRSEAGIRLEQEVRLPIDEMSKPGKWSKITDPQGFIQAIKSCIFSASRNMTTPILCCLNVCPDYIESTDRYRITRWVVKTGAAAPYLLPSWSAKYLPAYAPEKVCCIGGWAHFKNREGTVFSSRVYEGSFPEVGTFLDVEGAKIEFPESLIEVIDRARVMAIDNEGNEAINVKATGKKLEISSEGKSGWFKENIELPTTCTGFQFVIHPDNFNQILSKVRTAVVGSAAILFKNDKFSHVVAMEG